MNKQKALKQLSKLLSYVLNRKPDEFGLVPDKSGFIKIKELLKAISEEDGFRHVRKSNIDELLLTLPNQPFEIKESLIRGKSIENLPLLKPILQPPKLLYTCIRKKAHLNVNEKGIFPQGADHVILSSNIDLAKRMGKRKDAEAVLLTIQSEKSLEYGVTFSKFGDEIYLAEYIPTDCFTDPPLPKLKPEPVKPKSEEKKEPNVMPGSFLLNLPQGKKNKRQKESSWKQNKKRLRKQKEKKWPD